jgi:hypothetical protein
LIFTAASGWRPTELVVHAEANEPDAARAAARREMNRCLSIDVDCAVVVVDDDGLACFRTCGLVPVDIEERIWNAVDRPRRESGVEPAAPALSQRQFSELNTVSHELAGQARDERGHCEAMDLVVRLIPPRGWQVIVSPRCEAMDLVVRLIQGHKERNANPH